MSIFDALGYIGKPAESALLELIKHPDPKIQILAARALTNIPQQCQNPDIIQLCLETLNHPDPKILLYTIDILRLIGRYAQPAIPALLQTCEQIPSFCIMTATIFREIGDPALPLLRDALHSDSSPKQLTAIMSLVDTDPNLIVSDSLPDLIEMLSHQDDTIRRQSIKVLSDLGPRAQPAVSRLIQVLDPNDQYNYTNGFRALLNINPTDPNVIAFLNDTFQRPDGTLSKKMMDEIILHFLSKTFPPELSSIVIQTFIDSDHPFRLIFLDVMPLLPELGSSAQKLVPHLLDMLKFPDETYVGAVCNALITIDPEGTRDELIPVLTDFLHSSDEDKCRLAMIQLALLESLPSEVIPEQQALLNNKDISTRLQAAGILARIDPQHSSKLVTETLLYTIQNKRIEFRYRSLALSTLRLNDLQTIHMIPVLLDILQEENAFLRRHAVHILSGFPSESRLILPHLKRTLKDDEDNDVRDDAADAILKLDPNHPDPDVVDYLITGIMNEKSFSWHSQLATLSKLGPHAAPAVPALIEKLNAPLSNTRIDVIDTLAAIGPAAHDAIPHLQKLLNDPVKIVRQATAHALNKIQK